MKVFYMNISVNSRCYAVCYFDGRFQEIDIASCVQMKVAPTSSAKARM